ncbi:hypothetical protein [Allocoleopsis sp.]|uniref:hypothetical protein n=1 Tax=Allocoleopsis sp. TaxID=3088169 RepID=UPI002FD18724
MADNFAKTLATKRHGASDRNRLLFHPSSPKFLISAKMPKVKLDASGYSREWLVDP